MSSPAPTSSASSSTSSLTSGTSSTPTDTSTTSSSSVSSSASPPSSTLDSSPSTSSTSTSLPPSSTSSTTTTTSSTSSSSSTRPPSPTPTPSETKSTFLSTSNGNIITVTTVVRSTPSSTAAVNSNTSKGFFNNTGAVAGTFSVVGLVGLAILIFIVVTIIRRRRAERFDKDVALAAAEAAATSHSPDFDDYGYGYAGTYHQGPVTLPPTRETYNMSDIGATAYADPDNFSVGTGGGPGAAGIGAGGLYRSKSGANQPDPFNAYAAPHEPTIQQQANLRHRNPAQNQWEDPSLGVSGYDAARHVSQPSPDNGVVRSKSLQSNNPDPSLSSHYSTDPLTQDPYAQPPPMPESYLDHYRAGFDPKNHQPQARPLSTVSMTDAYGGVTQGNPLTQQPPLPETFGNVDNPPNPFDSQTSDDRRLSDPSDYEDSHLGHGHDDSRMSLRDDEDYGAGRRVLKIANE